MKHIKHLFAVCLLLLVATNATAQSQSDNTQTKAVSATKADVNGDGVVNEADIEEIIAIIKENNDVKYYWYAGNSEDIVKGDLAAGDIDWTKAQQVTSFDELNYSSGGTKITMVNSGINNVYILCPKSWSNKWEFWSKNNDINLTSGLLEVGEILKTTFVKDGVEYDLWWGDGFSGNTIHIRKK